MRLTWRCWLCERESLTEKGEQTSAAGGETERGLGLGLGTKTRQFVIGDGSGKEIGRESLDEKDCKKPRAN